MDVQKALLKKYILNNYLGYKNSSFPNHVFKLALFYLKKKVPRTWYEKLSTFLVSKGFKRGQIYLRLFIKIYENDIFIA